ncbi:MULTISPECIES: alpha/beta hydrolase [Cupriavidus]|uniref:alpha/beta hydrolase n=1 Tax=Cupriavidus sp. DF5525 TaxID=3160989 RepID=UPI00059EDC02
MLDPSLFGRLSFTPAEPRHAPLPPGRHHLGVAGARDAVLFVPDSLDPATPVPLLVMFHGAGGFPEKVLPHLESHAQRHGFLVLAPHSMFPTWDIVIGGNGPDLERLHQALTAVTSRYRIDPQRLGFAGFSDGASYALSLGITNGDIASHVMAFSGGFMSVFMQEGAPRVFVAHGLDDEQLPIATSGRANAARLKAAGYDVRYVEFDGLHVIHPPVVDQAIEFFLQ